MRDVFDRVAAWSRRHAAALWWTAGALTLVAGGLIVVLAVTREPQLPTLGHEEYVTAQRRLHAMESIVQLEVLRSAIQSDRPTADLQARLGTIQDDLEWALTGPETAGEVWPDVSAELDSLRRQLSQEDPAAVDTADRVRDLLAGARDTP